jgi:predicted secreted hydrolase
VKTLLIGLLALAVDWKIALPGWHYDFPRDHHVHREFKTEWWYFTGNLTDERGRSLGYEITFFREGIRPPGDNSEERSRFIVDDLKFAHFAVTDASGARFRFYQKTSRGSFGEAGFDDGARVAWIDSWSLVLNDDGSFDLAAESPDARAKFHLVAAKRPVIHGENGLSAKASGEGHASQYYSITRLNTTGELRMGSVAHALQGESWFDHEWATNQLAPDQVGWNWCGLQMSNGTELMLYQMRLKKGEIDPVSNGTLVQRDGTAVHLPAAAFRMTPTRFWKSKTSGANYPLAWRIEIPEQRLDLNVSPIVNDQELTLGRLTYWEGAVEVNGDGIIGRGYLELTGYAGPLKALSR